MRVLGVDIGMASIGFALLNYDLDTKTGFIEKMGVHLFDKAEQPKTGASLALARRTARQARKTIRRRVGRLKALRRLFESHNLEFIPADNTITHTFEEQNRANQQAVRFLSELAPWELRSQALQRKLEKKELARVLYHIAKHRGFKSTKKGETSDEKSESSKMLGAASQNRAAFLEAGYPTIGAYLYSERLEKGQKVRNRNGEYINTILRSLNEDEARLILKIQRENFSQTWITEKFIEEYCSIAFSQKPLKSVEDMVGDCTLEKLKGNSAPRAPRFSRSAELFVLWEKINHLRIIRANGQPDILTPEERRKVYEKAHSQKTIEYSHIRKCCNMAADDVFNMLSYTALKKKKKSKNSAVALTKTPEMLESWDAIVTQTEKTKFVELGGYYALKKILGEDLEGEQVLLWDEVAKILSFEQDVEAMADKLYARQEALKLSDEQILELIKIHDFKGTVNLSCQAIQALLPFLKEGKTYDKAVLEAGYQIKIEKKGTKLPPFEMTNNPVVNRALSQVRKVINAILREYGLPDKIHVELAREMTRTFDDRKKIENEQKANRALNEEIKIKIAEDFGGFVPPLKYKLWLEQQRLCLYSGLPISPEELKDETQTQIDHALPYARSFNNSYFNKVLVKTGENQHKGDRTVWEYFEKRKSPEEWDRLVHAVKYLPSQKRNNILNQSFDRHEEDWKDRHLNDTRWITRAVKTHIEQHLNLPGEPGKKQTVLAVNGSVTHYLRVQWGLEKDREESSKHHAQDAAVIAAATPDIIHMVANYNKYLRKAKGEPVRTPLPWDSFRRDIKQELDNIFVSRMPRRSVSGEIASPNPSRVIIHPESGKQIVIERVSLESLNEKKLEQLIGKEDRNKKLYEILLARLKEHGGKADRAFKEPVYLDKNARRHQVKKVSLYGSPESGKLIRGGLVSNGDQVRVDVFSKAGKFYLCPVYAWHFKIGETPNQVIAANKKVGDWPLIDDTYQFLFTLYPNDFVRLTQQDGQVFEGYYATSDISVAQIDIRSHDDSKLYPQKDTLVSGKGFGVMRLKSMEKYQIDYFGRRFPVKETERPPIKKQRVKGLDVAHSPHSEWLQTQPEKPAIEAGE